MATNIFRATLEIHERQRISDFVNSRTDFTENCYNWSGTSTTDGYGLCRFMFRGKRAKVRVHRLVYFMSVNRPVLTKMHVSHLCHNKLCVRPDHLSYEPQQINNKRLKCKNDGECSGHYAYPRCKI